MHWTTGLTTKSIHRLRSSIAVGVDWWHSITRMGGIFSAMSPDQPHVPRGCEYRWYRPPSHFLSRPLSRVLQSDIQAVVEFLQDSACANRAHLRLCKLCVVSASQKCVPGSINQSIKVRTCPSRLLWADGMSKFCAEKHLSTAYSRSSFCDSSFYEHHRHQLLLHRKPLIPCKHFQ